MKRGKEEMRGNEEMRRGNEEMRKEMMAEDI